MPTNEERCEVAARLRKLSNDAIKEKKKNACELSEAVRERCDAFCTNYACWSGTLNRLADLIEPEPERTCEWIQDEDGNWHTSCGDVFIVCNCESLEDNKIFHCFKCGGVIEVEE